METTMHRTALAMAPASAVLPAEDLDRARAFYRDVLGLSIKDYPEDRQFVAEAGSGTHFMVYERARTTAQHTTLGFEVDDLMQTVEELRSRGVRFEEYDMPGIKTENGIARMGDGSMVAWFTDTEGNIISVGAMSR